MYAIVVKTILGDIGIAEENGAIVQVSLTGAPPREPCVFERTPLLETAETQLIEYLGRKRRAFDLPLAPRGTPFQLRVWKALSAIPYGEVRSYEQIAIEIGCPRGCRAVGLANGKNPVSIFIPCHRVIGKDGGLTGFGGGLPMKRQLLSLEREAGPDDGSR